MLFLKERNKYANDKNFPNKILNYMKNKKRYLIALILNNSPYFLFLKYDLFFLTLKAL